jgi:hypothetical protein
MPDTTPHPQIFARRLIALYGGVEAARNAFDKRHREISDRWNQDAGLMGRILRAHLFVEHYLTDYLSTRNPNLGSTEKARLSFSQKVELADRPESPEAYLFTGIRRLNQVRNRLAHTLMAEVTEADRDAFLSIELFRALRDALAAPQTASTDPIDVLEDFARHAGITFEAAANPERELLYQALWGTKGEPNESDT